MLKEELSTRRVDYNPSLCLTSESKAPYPQSTLEGQKIIDEFLTRGIAYATLISNFLNGQLSQSQFVEQLLFHCSEEIGFLLFDN